MDILTASAQFSLLEVVGIRRRRRWTVAGKVSIVEESPSGPGLRPRRRVDMGFPAACCLPVAKAVLAGPGWRATISAVMAPGAGAAGEPATGGRMGGDPE